MWGVISINTIILLGCFRCASRYGVDHTLRGGSILWPGNQHAQVTMAMG